MLKLYGKKLLGTLLFLVAFLCLAAGLVSIWTMLLPNVLTVNWRMILCTVLAFGLCLTEVYYLRRDNKTAKEAYLETVNKKKAFFFGKELVKTLRSPENVLHILALVTLLLPFFLLVGISANTAVWPLVGGTAILLAGCCLLFLVANVLIWTLVHKYWHSGTQKKTK